MIKMNKVFTFLFVLLISGVSAQNWELISEDADYRIEQRHEVCKSTQGYDYDYRILKFSNLSNDEIEIAFNFQRWYNGDFCQGCGQGDHDDVRIVTLPPNSSIQGDCVSAEDYLRVFDHAVTVNEKVWKSKLTELVVNKIIITKN